MTKRKQKWPTWYITKHQPTSIINPETIGGRYSYVVLPRGNMSDGMFASYFLMPRRDWDRRKTYTGAKYDVQK